MLVALTRSRVEPYERACWHAGLGFLAPGLTGVHGSLSDQLEAVEIDPEGEIGVPIDPVDRVRLAFEDYSLSVIGAGIAVPIDYTEGSQAVLLNTMSLVGLRLSDARCRMGAVRGARTFDEMILALFTIQTIIFAGDDTDPWGDLSRRLDVLAQRREAPWIRRLSRRIDDR